MGLRPPVPYESVWLGAAPPDGPVSAGSITLGFWFRLDVTGVLRGFRHYMASGNSGVHIAQLWAADGVTLLANASTKAAVATRVAAANEWRSIWCHPRVQLAADTLYLAQVAFDGSFVFRDDSALVGTDVVSGHITVPMQNEAGTHGGRYYEGIRFNDAADNPTGNLYGIDVMVDFTL